ncbi:MAG: glycosyltransferase [Actinomycetota bacterium]
MATQPTIVFFPEGAYGPTNNCVGIADVLAERGARVVFVVEESFAGTLEAKGFEESRMRLKPAPEVEEEPGQFWKDFIRDTAPEFRKTTFEQIETLTKPIWEELIDGAKYVDERLRAIFEDVDPDVIVQDNVVAFPAVPASGRPWARVMSCNPLELPDPDLPPAFSGLASDDLGGWAEFRRRYDAAHSDLHTDFDDFCREREGPPLPDRQFMYESDYLNLYLYPKECDYQRTVEPSPTWHRLDSSVRATDEPFALPESLVGDGPIIYLSLGSLGSADVALMTRLIELLGRTSNRVIVSMGPQHDRLQLADNMVGAEFLPQTSILPLVDLVVTHGGNNTVTECFHFGKPMVVLPLFWDQYDNAQRVSELDFGVRLQSYAFEDAHLYDAIDRLLKGADRRERMLGIAARLQAQPGTQRAADLIWRLAEAKQPLHR